MGDLKFSFGYASVAGRGDAAMYVGLWNGARNFSFATPKRSIGGLHPYHGTCGIANDADEVGDCERGTKGAWRLRPHERLGWAVSGAACFELCSACHQCRYISVSSLWGDCRWFHSCSLQNLQTLLPGFRTSAMPGRSSAQEHHYSGDNSSGALL